MMDNIDKRIAAHEAAQRALARGLRMTTRTFRRHELREYTGRETWVSALRETTRAFDDALELGDYLDRDLVRQLAASLAQAGLLLGGAAIAADIPTDDEIRRLMREHTELLERYVELGKREE
jgi:hypothetical protein